MQVSKAVNGSRSRVSAHFLVQAAVAAALTGTSFSVATAAEEADSQLEEITVTGSRITRRDTETASPLITVEKETLERSSYISLEQALNELPEFMAGGALDGRARPSRASPRPATSPAAPGSGNMFDTARGIDNARMGTFTPGAGHGQPARPGSEPLADADRRSPRHRGQRLGHARPEHRAADRHRQHRGHHRRCLVGVRRRRARGCHQHQAAQQLRRRRKSARAAASTKYGGDGKEWQLSTLMGTSIGGQGPRHGGHGLQQARRSRCGPTGPGSATCDAVEHHVAVPGNYLFGIQPVLYTAGPDRHRQRQRRHEHRVQQRLVGQRADPGGDQPGVLRTACLPWRERQLPHAHLNGGGFYFNGDGTLFTRSSVVTQAGVNDQFGPQSFNGVLAGTEANPDEVICNYATGNRNFYPGFQQTCAPVLGTRRLRPPPDQPARGASRCSATPTTPSTSTSPRIRRSASRTRTPRRGASPRRPSGNWTVAIPYNSDPNAVYLPSVAHGGRARRRDRRHAAGIPRGRLARPVLRDHRRLHRCSRPSRFPRNWPRC